jgi:ABC-type Fe3+/spermidine/putrescine transport system ATPase subunit
MGKVVLDGLEKVYSGGVQALTDASLTVNDGEFVTIVGPSGCGKTTTLRILAGFETPSGGHVRTEQRELTHVPPDKRNTGMVFQDFALFPHKTVAENVEYGLTIGGDWSQEAAKDRVAEMLELVELPEFGDRYPEQLSGGQQQRIALARALAPSPDVLLLDEPLASLDKKLRENMQVELRRIQQKVGITTILVTHNQQEALTMSDRVAVMNDGSFEQVGRPKDVYNNPETRFVADFVGKSNIYDGEVTTATEQQTVINCDGLRFELPPQNFVEGSEVSIIVRPEKTEIQPSDPELNTFEGYLEITRFLGDRVEYHVDVGNGKEAVIVTPPDEEPSQEEDVTVGIDGTDCRVIPNNV